MTIRNSLHLIVPCMAESGWEQQTSMLPESSGLTWADERRGSALWMQGGPRGWGLSFEAVG